MIFNKSGVIICLMERRDFLKILPLIPFVAAEVINGCSSQPKKVVSPMQSGKDKLSTEQWQLLSPEERINYIQKNNYPEELLGRHIAQKTGPYLPASDAYTAGANLIESVNQHAGITSVSFIDYTTGRKSIAEFLDKWGSFKKPTDRRAALRSLIMVGFAAQGLIDETNAEKNIIQFLL